MTRQGIAALLDAIDRQYPVFKVNRSPEDIKALFYEWGALFAEYSDEDIIRALTEHVKSNPKPPTVADLLKYARRERFLTASEPPKIEAPRMVLDLQTLAEELRWVAWCEFNPPSEDKKQVYDKFISLYGYKYDMRPLLSRLPEPWQEVEL